MNIERKLRRQAAAIFRAALLAADPGRAIFAHITLRNGVLRAGDARYRLRDFRKIHVVGAGKAGATMAQLGSAANTSGSLRSSLDSATFNTRALPW